MRIDEVEGIGHAHADGSRATARAHDRRLPPNLRRLE
jgi:hypothetical protein